jgi:site-specific recombinase XerD
MMLPIERFTLPAAFNGRDGANRARGAGASQIEAETDLEAIMAWLSEFRDSPNTLRAYRREAERLLLWAILARGKPLSSLLREDLMAYEDFLSDPQPREVWCGPKVSRKSPDWRPFEGPLSAASKHQSMVILDGMFAYLVEAGYLAGNPLALRRRRRHGGAGSQPESIERFLDRGSWEFLLGWLDRLPTDTPRKRAKAERLRFLFSLLYLLGPRLHEVANHTMGSFVQRRGKWWWSVIGKGKKHATIPVPDEMMGALARYRTYLGLSPAPLPDDATPLALALDGKTGITDSMIYKLVKGALRAAAAELEPRDPVRAAQLRAASTHWLRHTAISHQADLGLDLNLLRKSARHARLDTTALYLHAEEDRWHQAVQRHRLRNQDLVNRAGETESE